ncbi:MAG: hypothetical protein NC094_08535 [Bacteroidales bacterium]|nr:hypothetical protein [Lachnoclostridium sp.]MCM1384061.1 hypothetical protein [Lachnoclostridium sp.]MCM1465451.1 hypothetical protein [Bacteroidales bacterium]
MGNSANDEFIGKYLSITGTIVEMAPTRMGRRMDGCTIFITLEDETENTVNFILTSDTYVVDNVTLSVGMSAIFWYRTDVPVPLIYPPQYRAVVAAEKKNDRMINVSHYNHALVNEEQTLQLNLDRAVELRTTNNQYYQANPADNDLVVIYQTSTRSIPAQTTPKKIVVLCGD